MGPHGAIAVAGPAWLLSVTATQCWLSRLTFCAVLISALKCVKWRHEVPAREQPGGGREVGRKSICCVAISEAGRKCAWLTKQIALPGRKCWQSIPATDMIDK